MTNDDSQVTPVAEVGSIEPSEISNPHTLWKQVTGVVIASIILFFVVYAFLFLLFLYLLNRKIQHGPDEAEKVEYSDAPKRTISGIIK